MKSKVGFWRWLLNKALSLASFIRENRGIFEVIAGLVLIVVVRATSLILQALVAAVGMLVMLHGVYLTDTEEAEKEAQP